MPSKHITLRLDAEAQQALDALAAAQGITPSAALRAAVLFAHRLAPFQAQVLVDLAAIKTDLGRLTQSLSAGSNLLEPPVGGDHPTHRLIIDMPPEIPTPGRP